MCPPFTYSINVQTIAQVFVMRFDLATGIKPMFEEELFIAPTSLGDCRLISWSNRIEKQA